MESPLLMRHKDGDFDMQVIGTFLSFASRGDRVGLNQLLRQGISPNVQDYDKRTALHLAASEGHASIVELLLAYKADVNLKDRWRRTTVRHEEDSIEENIDISELNLQHSSMLEQGNLQDILGKRLDPTTALRYALDIARNLLLDEGGHIKIGEYWVQILDNQIFANQDGCQLNSGCNLINHLCHDTSKDIHSFGLIFYQMLEGRQITDRSSEPTSIKSVDLEKKLYTGRYPSRILQLIEDCTCTVPSTRPSFATAIEILEEVSLLSRKRGCPPCNKSRSPK
ncbi:hypothetical protein CQW23_05307 [Capsicum baccatum]|uniref:Serine-threonine/tyrosine-protein kinase catalytic domain-containing protein n=1 Tax=Capsicum baccatum TaxID=33114 RepID=A0A2G2XHK2_CAPBA|nr:hypothetical protein CQW23_05307 [Capsicum baccatum]